MALSKQLYVIIAFIFLIIFTGNFIISIENTKEYLEIESTTKAQDTATSLGMSLRALIKDKHDPEIKSIIRAISNSGFYKEIRLEDASFEITTEDLISSSKELNGKNWKISNISLDKKFGKIESKNEDEQLDLQLEKLENEDTKASLNELDTKVFKYIPSEKYKNGGNIIIYFTAKNENKTINTFALLNMKKILVEEKRPIKFDYVPLWFIKSINFNLPEKFSEISDGWNTTAIIYVSSNPGEAYAKLYEEAKSSIVYSVVAFILSMIILLIFVQFLLKPLKKIESLAKNIAKGKFETIEKLPWTTEIKNVAISMNDMSRKIESIINKLNKNLEILSKKLSEDELTKLPLRQTFETDMKNMFIHKDKGYVFSIKIDKLAHFAKIHNNEEIDSLIIKFANILKNISTKDEIKASSYRFFGSEFVMIIKNCDDDNAKNICKDLKEKFDKLCEEFALDEIAYIGATPFNEISTTPEMLQAANEAFEKAKIIGPNEFYIRDKNDLTRDINVWRDLVFEIIDNSDFEVSYINDAYDLSSDEKTLIMQEAFTKAKDKEGNPIAIGTFVSIAEKYEKVVDFDKKVIKKVINHIQINGIKHDISINLSLDSIVSNDFISWLENIVKENSSISSQLVFSITAYAVAKDINSFKNFCEKVHESGAKIIIKRFESKFIEIETIKECNLDYIRLARDYTNQIDNDSSKKAFVESINELAILLNIKVFAESVKSDNDLKAIKSLKLYGASR